MIVAPHCPTYTMPARQADNSKKNSFSPDNKKCLVRIAGGNQNPHIANVQCFATSGIARSFVDGCYYKEIYKPAWANAAAWRLPTRSIEKCSIASLKSR